MSCRATRPPHSKASPRRRIRRSISSTSSIRRSMQASPIQNSRRGWPIWAATVCRARPPTSQKSSPTKPRNGARWSSSPNSRPSDRPHQLHQIDFTEGDIMEFPRRRFLQLTGAAAFAPITRAARADTYPSRVVKLVVGFPPGGGADLAARIVVNGLSDIWGQQVIVENRPGAGARLALDAVAHAPPDGYTMLLEPGSPQVQAFLFSTLTFDPAVDFAPVSLVGTYPNIIAVANNSSFNTLQDFIAHAKANPGKVSWASPGVGTVPHLSG